MRLSSRVEVRKILKNKSELLRTLLLKTLNARIVFHAVGLSILILKPKRQKKYDSLHSTHNVVRSVFQNWNT